MVAVTWATPEMERRRRNMVGDTEGPEQDVRTVTDIIPLTGGREVLRSCRPAGLSPVSVSRMKTDIFIKIMTMKCVLGGICYKYETLFTVLSCL